MAVELEMKGKNQFTVHYANSPPPKVAEERFNRSGFDNFDLVLAEVLQSQVYFFSLFLYKLYFLGRFTCGWDILLTII